jgi:hypothetical protein
MMLLWDTCGPESHYLLHSALRFVYELFMF